MTPDIFVDLAIESAIAGLGIDWLLERARLRRFVSGLGPLPTDDYSLSLALADKLASRPHPPDAPYIAAILGPLGATASSVIKRGGCCSGTSRLYILTLRMFGIPAYQVTVHHRSGRAQHCLVEVHLRRGRLIVDPVYGLYYTDAGNRMLGLEDLQAGLEVEFRSVRGEAKSGYPAGGYYDFDFKQTKTVNWTKSRVRKFAYLMLRHITNSRIDRFRVPPLLEWPQVLLSLILIAMLAVWRFIMFVWYWSAPSN